MKNIEINIKEQDTYEALLPASISNVVYSSDTVNFMFNLSEGSKIDDAFSAISTNFDPLMANLGIVTVKLWDGTPVEGISLDGGIKDNNGNTPVTDANGRAVVSTNTDEFTFSVASLWADISDVPSQSYPKTGAPTYISVTMADKGIRRLEVTSSQNIRFSKAIKTFDVFGVGGGGGGRSIFLTPNYSGWNVCEGTGGAGGYTTTSLAVVNDADVITVTVGGGGKAGQDGRRLVMPSTGGNTIVTRSSGNILTANGGEPGVAGTTGQTDFTGGASGGSGGSSIWYYAYSGSSQLKGDYSGGYNGSDGGAKGQGTTTTEFGEGTGVAYSAGGASVFWQTPYSGSGSGRVAQAGQGGGTATLNGATSSSEGINRVLITAPTTYGSGGSGNAYIKVGGDDDYLYASAGMQGVVIFRWTV